MDEFDMYRHACAHIHTSPLACASPRAEKKLNVKKEY